MQWVSYQGRIHYIVNSDCVRQKRIRVVLSVNACSHLDFSQLSSVKAGDFAKPSAAAPATNPGSSAKAK